MAHFKASPNKPNVLRNFFTGSDSIRKTGFRYHHPSSKSKDVRCMRRKLGEKRNFNWERQKEVSFLAPYCSSATSSSAIDVGLTGEGGRDGRKCEVSDKSFGYLINELGWRVRRLIEEEDEMRKVAQVQAEAFHAPSLFFNDLFFQFFKAEVLSGLIYKLRNSPPNRYACLVAEPAESTDLNHISQQRLVGVVDVTVLRDESVLNHLEGAEEYIYVSGIAVPKEFRRQKVATVLLKACDLLSLLWGYDYLVLRAYEDDMAARKLYTNAGYRVVSADPAWMTTWIGRKCRVLMVKRSSLGGWF